jgi:S1-C subfamily serine protease
MRRKLPAILLSLCPLLLSLPAADAQEIKKSVLDHIRSVSVSIEWNGRCHGSGTIFDKDGESWCLTACHVVEAAQGRQIRVSQYRPNGKVISVNAEVVRADTCTDVALLKIGKGVFGTGAQLYTDCCREGGKPPELDTPIVHCGSMAGLHHTITRGYLVGVDRDVKGILEHGPKLADQADLTGSYGSSGGGVFLADGRFIGMVYAGIPQRIVFFVPIRRMKL